MLSAACYTCLLSALSSRVSVITWPRWGQLSTNPICLSPTLMKDLLYSMQLSMQLWYLTTKHLDLLVINTRLKKWNQQNWIIRNWISSKPIQHIGRDSIMVSSPVSLSRGTGFDNRQRPACSGLTNPATLMQGSVNWYQFRLGFMDPLLWIELSGRIMARNQCSPLFI